MSRPIASLVLGAALTIPCVAGAASWTSLIYQLSATSQATISDQIGDSEHGALVSVSDAIPGGSSVYGLAAPGVLKAGAWSDATVISAGGGVGMDTTAHMHASFFDQAVLMPADTALIGQMVTINAGFLLDGGMVGGYSVSGNSTVYFSLGYWGSASISGTGMGRDWITARESSQWLSPSLPTSVHETAPGFIPVSISARLGDLVGLQYVLDVQSRAAASFGFRECGEDWVGQYWGPCGAVAHAAMDADFSHSMRWAGISSVIDADGNPVELASALGDSGFDYLHAAVVPLPASGWLLLSGLALLARLRRPAASAT